MKYAVGQREETSVYLHYNNRKPDSKKNLWFLIKNLDVKDHIIFANHLPSLPNTIILSKTSLQWRVFL